MAGATKSRTTKAVENNPNHIVIPTTAKESKQYLEEQKIEIELGAIRASDGTLRFFIDELYDPFGYTIPLSQTISWYAARLLMSSKYGDRFIDLSMDDLVDSYEGFAHEIY
jgi:hypothetical protein